MIWKFAADCFAVFHGLNVGFVILGPIFAFRFRWIRVVHLVSLWWNFFVAASGMYCPMTNFENSIRVRYDPSHAYYSGFIVHYISPMLWWDLTQRHVVIGMIAWAVILTLVYVWFWAMDYPKEKPSA